jgi:hypothetical protein
VLRELLSESSCGLLLPADQCDVAQGCATASGLLLADGLPPVAWPGPPPIQPASATCSVQLCIYTRGTAVQLYRLYSIVYSYVLSRSCC